MALSSELRRAGPYDGDGVQTAFPFSFKVFDSGHVQVRTSKIGAPVDVVVESDRYTVELNDEQDLEPGGVVHLDVPLAPDEVLSVLSAAPALQEMVLTNQGGFYPEVLNDSADNAVILIQQLKEKLDRALVVASTSRVTSAELLDQVLSVAASANEFAELARKTYEETLVTKAQVEQARLHVDQQKALVDASEAEVEEDRIEVEQMLHDAQKVNAVTEKFLPHVEELVEVGNSIEDVQAVASELQGFPIDSMDLGFVRDGASPVYDTSESNIALLAKHLEAIRTVVANLDTIKTALPSALRAEQAAQEAQVSADEAEDSASRVVDIERTDYETIYQNGV